jgi:hypothetical protein
MYKKTQIKNKKITSSLFVTSKLCNAFVKREQQVDAGQSASGLQGHNNLF